MARRRPIPIADDLPQRHLLVLINATQTVNAAYIFGMVWMPAVAAILTCRILGRPLRTVGLGTWNGRYVLIGYLIPIAYCLVASLDIWLFGFGEFAEYRVRPPDRRRFRGGRSTRLGGDRDVRGADGTTGMLSGVAAATGEEIGGRRFLHSPSWPRSCRSPLSRWGLRFDLGGLAPPDHRRRLPGCRPSAVFWLLTFTFVAVAIGFAQTLAAALA